MSNYFLVEMVYSLSSRVLVGIIHSIKMESSGKVLTHDKWLINIHFFLPPPSLITLLVPPLPLPLLSLFMLLDNATLILNFGFCFCVCPQPDCLLSPSVLAFSDVEGRDDLFDLSNVQPLAELALIFTNLNLKSRVFPHQ